MQMVVRYRFIDLSYIHKHRWLAHSEPARHCIRKVPALHRWSNNEKCQMNVRLAGSHRSQAARQKLAGLLHPDTCLSMQIYTL